MATVEAADYEPLHVDCYASPAAPRLPVSEDSDEVEPLHSGPAVRRTRVLLLVAVAALAACAVAAVAARSATASRSSGLGSAGALRAYAADSAATTPTVTTTCPPARRCDAPVSGSMSFATAHQDYFINNMEQVARALQQGLAAGAGVGTCDVAVKDITRVSAPTVASQQNRRLAVGKFRVAFKVCNPSEAIPQGEALESKRPLVERVTNAALATVGITARVGELLPQHSSRPTTQQPQSHSSSQELVSPEPEPEPEPSYAQQLSGQVVFDTDSADTLARSKDAKMALRKGIAAGAGLSLSHVEIGEVMPGSKSGKAGLSGRLTVPFTVFLAEQHGLNAFASRLASSSAKMLQVARAALLELSIQAKLGLSEQIVVQEGASPSSGSPSASKAIAAPEAEPEPEPDGDGASEHEQPVERQ